MKMSKRKGKKREELRPEQIRDLWPLSMMIQLSQKILTKGLVKGDGVVFSEEDRKKLLSYSSKIKPMLEKIKQTHGAEVGPLERVIDDLREKIDHFSHPGKNA